ncbi:ImmA/IrrE family metallo-endopeptidase [Staphylococcus americanisciuri]|uniref:ImmA/IrrE family metallo-endopeptidase n=1 Tax=Staphylococcus americanisciuri TaxID=2973940 RepID=A0ABT2F3E7_9STAP|nr:ImmA/IrrE family metallo-endopeptidase [Staphylococcus americanisciuri]MCS4486342.1 ImmA/IrrE family metallo-endopeptidase [Staphylococcus americanisciuri]
MGKYEEALIHYDQLDINDTFNLPGKFKGFYDNGVILIDRDLPTSLKYETLIEEVGHHKYTYGNIVDQSDISNVKYELKARRYAFENIVTLQGLIEAFEFGVSNIHELADFFEVTIIFVKDSLEHYKRKHGLEVKHGDYLIRFEPLTIYKNV